jgi:hypothetical protein
MAATNEKATPPKKSLSKALWSLTCSLCLATLAAQVLLLGVAWQRGWLQADRLQRAKEAFYGIQRREIRTQLVSTKTADGGLGEDVSLRERALRISDMPLRSNISRRDSIEGGVDRNSLRIDQSRYEQTRIGFDRALQGDIVKLETAAIEAVQGMLEQMAPPSAKEHIMLMLTSPGDNDPKRALDDVVAVMKRIAPDRRRKIFAEFQSPEEAAHVESMLRRIREAETPLDADKPAAGGGQPP